MANHTARTTKRGRVAGPSKLTYSVGLAWLVECVTYSVHRIGGSVADVLERTGTEAFD